MNDMKQVQTGKNPSFAFQLSQWDLDFYIPLPESNSGLSCLDSVWDTGQQEGSRRARETERQEDKKKTASQQHTNKKQHVATTDSRTYVCAVGE